MCNILASLGEDIFGIGPGHWAQVWNLKTTCLYSCFGENLLEVWQSRFINKHTLVAWNLETKVRLSKRKVRNFPKRIQKHPSKYTVTPSQKETRNTRICSLALQKGHPENELWFVIWNSIKRRLFALYILVVKEYSMRAQQPAEMT